VSKEKSPQRTRDSGRPSRSTHHQATVREGQSRMATGPAGGLRPRRDHASSNEPPPSSLARSQDISRHPDHRLVHLAPVDPTWCAGQVSHRTRSRIYRSQVNKPSEPYGMALLLLKPCPPVLDKTLTQQAVHLLESWHHLRSSRHRPLICLAWRRNRNRSLPRGSRCCIYLAF